MTDLIPPPNCQYFFINKTLGEIEFHCYEETDSRVTLCHLKGDVNLPPSNAYWIGFVSAVAEKFWRLEHKRLCAEIDEKPGDVIRVTIRLTAIQVCTKQIDLWSKWGEGK